MGSGEESGNESVLAVHKAPIIIVSNIGDSIPWKLIRYVKDTFPRESRRK